MRGPKHRCARHGKKQAGVCVSYCGIPDMVSFGSKSEVWWRQNLGLPTDDYWAWSDEYQNWYHMNDDGTCEWAPPGESSAGPSQKPKGSSKRKSRGSRR